MRRADRNDRTRECNAYCKHCKAKQYRWYWRRLAHKILRKLYKKEIKGILDSDKN